MSEIPATDIEGWIHTSVQDEVIEAGEFPIGFDLSDTLTPVTIHSEVVDKFQPSIHSLVQVSTAHARSYELGPNSDKRGKMGKLALWSDEFHNQYSSYSLKGNNFSIAQVVKSGTAPSGYIPFGLMESDALVRVLRSSRTMREAGISTEWINRVFEPKYLIHNGEPIPQEEYKKRIINEAAENKGFGEAAKIAAAIEPMTFFILGRSMEINDRLGDFMIDTPESARQRVRHIFNVYNHTHQEDEGFKHLIPSRSSDRRYFFEAVLPELIGQNVAKLHNLDLVHNFPHIGNITALGGLVDLDSVKGESLGLEDKKVDDMNKAYDINYVIDSANRPLVDFYRKLYRLGITEDSTHYSSNVDTLSNAYMNSLPRTKNKKDALVRELVKASTVIESGGAKALLDYKEYAPREAGKMLDALMTLSANHVKSVWSEENIRLYVNHEIDLKLDIITEQIQREREVINLSQEHFKDRIKYINDGLDFGVLNLNQTIKEFDKNIELFPKFEALLPLKRVRVRALNAILVTLTGISNDEHKKDMGEYGRTELIERILSEEVQKFLENISEIEWDKYSRHIEGFDHEGQDLPSAMITHHHKNVLEWSDMSFEKLLETTANAEINIKISSKSYEHNLSATPPKETLNPRLGYTDATYVRLVRLRVSGKSHPTTIGLDVAENSKPSTYTAWICEPEKKGRKPTLYIRHILPEEAKKTIESFLGKKIKTY